MTNILKLKDKMPPKNRCPSPHSGPPLRGGGGGLLRSAATPPAGRGGTYTTGAKSPVVKEGGEVYGGGRQIYKQEARMSKGRSTFDALAWLRMPEGEQPLLVPLLEDGRLTSAMSREDLLREVYDLLQTVMHLREELELLREWAQFADGLLDEAAAELEERGEDDE